MTCRQAVWANCQSHRDAVLLGFKAVTAHLECYDLAAQISPEDPKSIDIEFLHFEPAILGLLQSLPGVLKVGLLEGPHVFKSPAETRAMLEEELNRLMQETQASSA